MAEMTESPHVFDTCCDDSYLLWRFVKKIVSEFVQHYASNCINKINLSLTIVMLVNL